MAGSTPKKFRSPEVWGKVKAAYLAGDTAVAVCERFNVGLANLRRRAGAEGWTRAKAALRDPTEPAVAAGPDAIDPPAYAVSPQRALGLATDRAAWLVAEGRSAEATALLRAARELAALVDQNGLQRHSLFQSEWRAPVAPAKAGVL